MSRNGSNLADWQDIYNGVNERRKATMFWDWYSPALLPVVQSKNHITHSDAIHLVPAGSFCDPYTPLTFQTWDDSERTGIQPNGVKSLGSGSPSAICRYVPQFGSVPVVGSYLAGSGWFLDWIDGALGYMTKAASRISPTAKRYRAWLQLDEYGMQGRPPGSVWDGIAGEYIPGLIISSYADLWDYAVQHLHEDTTSYWDTIWAEVRTSSTLVDIWFASWTIPHPGVIPADLTLYYSAMGDNLGYTPTNYSQSGGPYVRGYATLTKQAASAASPLTFGFTSSVIPNTTPAPGYYVREELSNFYAVWDFAPYFQY